jgi:hypothetical protein
VGYKNLKYFEFFKSLFLIFEINIQTLNILLLFLDSIFQKIKNNDLENSKYTIFLYPMRFSYENLNEHVKSEIKR